MENFIVSARKYRPGTFDDVVGQGSITGTLRNSIRNNHLSHAYLFSGPRGVGKTTCARIFAKTINCEQISEKGEACNQCESCVSFNESRSYSIHELDAASNNSVDDIRLLTEKVRIPPQIGKYSIYIIDEVHMLSQSAFNAFLKTLEEPPAHAIFVLATTEKHKIIPTILSRCQIFDFNRIRVEDAASYLRMIADKEGIKYEEDALHLIAQKADGAMRDALSIFDQVVSFAGESINYADVITNLNILDYDYFFKLTFSLLEGDLTSSMLLFNEVLSRGFDGRNFINAYAAHLRDLMVCKDPSTMELMEVGAGIKEKYKAQASSAPLSFLYSGLEICNQADIQYRSSRNQRLTVELALIKLAGLNEEVKKKAQPDPGQASPEIKEVPVKQELKDSDNAIPAPTKKVVKPAEEKTEERERELTPREEKKAFEVGAPPSTLSIKDTLMGRPGKAPHDTKSEPAGEEAVSSRREKAEPGEIMDAWNKFKDEMQNSRPRVFSTLAAHNPEIREDGSVFLSLSSEAQRENFVSNIRPELCRFIEKELGLASLDIKTELIDNNGNSGKIYTDDDRLNHLISLNPELGELKNRFKLDFDH